MGGGAMIADRRIDPQEVSVSGVHARPGAAVTARLEVAGLDEAHHPFVTLVGGDAPGPVVTVIAGVHGAEVSSIEAARRLSTRLGGRLQAGTVLVVPVANLASFYARSLYVNPVDQKNLNRVFPGRSDGSASERLAHALVEALVRPADVVFDLHGGDSVEALDPFMLAVDLPGRGIDPRALEMADHYALDQVVAGHTEGALVAVATAMGKAALLAECGQQGILSDLAARRHYAGVTRVLSALGMVDEDAPPPSGHPVFRPFETWVRSERSGFWLPDPGVVAGRELGAGTRIGRILPMRAGDAAVDVVSPHAGRLLFLVTALSTTPGTPLCAVASEAQDWPV
jgi:uncharacterized protein